MGRTTECLVGVLVAGARAVGIAAAVLGAAAASRAQTCNNAGPDVAIGDVYDVSNFTPVGEYDAIALGAQVSNTGSASLAYSGCPNQHPIFGGNLYRYSIVNGAPRFEQIGQSWLKHASVAVNASVNCSCGGSGAGLRAGCSDLYSAGFQSSQGTLGPRYQVNAFTGAFVLCPTHPSGGNFGRLEFLLSDVVPTAGGTGAVVRYFAEEHAIAIEDATYTDATHPLGSNGFNNASNVELSASGTSANYTFAKLGSTQIGTPAIRRWKQLDPTVTETFADVPGEGRFIVSSKATSLGGSPEVWRYEYAVFNLNSDRCAGSFAVPLGNGSFNPGFHGVVYRGGDGNGGVNFDGNPWSGAAEGNQMVWRTQDYAANASANAIRWSTLYNFRFDSTSAPASSGSVTIGLWKPGAAGAPTSVSATAQVPSCGPTITSQPASAFACPTGAATFSVSAIGMGTLSYAWQLETAPGAWQTLGNDPFPLTCTGGGTGAFAHASPIFSPTVAIGVRACPGVTSYRVRCVVTDQSGCESAASAPATYTICRADFNCSSALSVLDIFDYLNAWLGASPAAEFDDAPGLTQNDIFSFINTWFAGC